MSRKLPALVALLGVAAAMASCVPPKAIVVAEDPALVVPAPQTPHQAGDADSAPASAQALPSISDDGLRMPDMLGLPEDKELRASKPSGSSTSGGAVISRPPTEPPPRQKSE